MSSIKLKLSGTPDLRSLFRTSCSRRSRRSYNRSDYGHWAGYLPFDYGSQDDVYDEDVVGDSTVIDMVFGTKEDRRRERNNSRKRGGRGSKKDKRRYKNDEEKFDSDINPADATTIYFWWDLDEEPEEQYVTIFRSLSEFSEFCENMMYEVPDAVSWNLCYCDESHCCINPTGTKDDPSILMREDTKALLKQAVLDCYDDYYENYEGYYEQYDTNAS